jgi:hypothetical protein
LESAGGDEGGKEAGVELVLNKLERDHPDIFQRRYGKRQIRPRCRRAP